MANTTLTPVEAPQRYSFSLRTKLVLGFTLLSAFVSFLTIIGMFNNLRGQVLDEFRNLALAIARLTSSQIKGDELQQVANAGDENYENIQLVIQSLRSSDANIRRLFILRKDAQGFYFIARAGESEAQNLAGFGERYNNPSALLLKNFDNLKEAIAESEVFTGSEGAVLTAYAPVLTSSGEITGILGVDIFADAILQRQRQILLQAFVVFLVALGLAAFFGYVAGNALTEPVTELIKGARAFASGQLDQHIALATRDEIEELAATFNGMADDTRRLISDLESRVAERTQGLEARSRELESANRSNQRRAAQFEALAQVTQSLTSIRDLQELLPRITTVVSEKFGFYHVGIFLLDEISEYAMLIAANSEGGRKMLARRHRLRVGAEGLVGYVTSTGKPRIALDVGQDAVFFNNPDLPETHSEAALPLINKNIIVGALDVQSVERAAFTDDDIQMLSLLADQISLAIENARLFDETRKALAESEFMTRHTTRETWARLAEQQKLPGFRYDTAGAAPLKQPVRVEKGWSEINPQKTGTAQFVVPIELRGEVIGELIVQSASEKTWSNDQLDLIKAVAERVALSAENARLFEETTARADRERLVTEITGKIRSNNDPQAMIDTALQELRFALGASRVEVVTPSNTDKNQTIEQGKVQP